LCGAQANFPTFPEHNGSSDGSAVKSMAASWKSGQAFTIPATFPNGYHAFYLMKYEISEGMWTEFIMSLTESQKLNRDILMTDKRNETLRKKLEANNG